MSPPRLARGFLEVEPDEVAASAGLAQIFAVYLLILNLSLEPSAEQWCEADPVLSLAPGWLMLWLVPALSLSAAVLWLVLRRPPRAIWFRAAKLGALGLVVGAVACGALRLIAGPVMPSFVPVEESARPGFLLSMAAGYGEEVVFRLLLLPALYFALARTLSKPGSALIASFITALAFALLHEVGGHPFSLAFFLTRTLLPGLFMSLFYFAAGPSFIIAAHSAAHIGIPLLFL